MHAIVWLNRPEAKNALNKSMVKELDCIIDGIVGNGRHRMSVHFLALELSSLQAMSRAPFPRARI